MFRCRECQSTEFQLVVQPQYEGTVGITLNEFNEVVVTTPRQEFIADLMFMNQFAICRDCGAIKSWEYFFQNDKKKQTASVDSSTGILD